jgi:hypothetical protein
MAGLGALVVKLIFDVLRAWASAHRLHLAITNHAGWGEPCEPEPGYAQYVEKALDKGFAGVCTPAYADWF